MIQELTDAPVVVGSRELGPEVSGLQPSSPFHSKPDESMLTSTL